ncbi:MAG: sulfotransferase, partial [SAR324 cluster bacterium]|nr:sulfotransferase [SAR324 cluster bacterium]
MKVIIVGLPRSGTSFLTGLVSKMGFDPGPDDSLRPANEYNPDGYFENLELMDIDHKLLKKFGGDVTNPQVLPKNWLDQCEEEKKKIKEIVARNGVEIYKGNMLIVLADLYCELFPDAKWIFISREDDKVMQSMMKGDGVNVRTKEVVQGLVTRRKELWLN